jgi:hypothetical protein
MTTEYLLSIVCTPAQEELLIDWLLLQKGLTGFSTLRIHGHGVLGQQLSLTEQVTGRQAKVMFKLHATLSVLQNIIQGLKQDFTGTGLHYWLVPLLEAGHL